MPASGSPRSTTAPRSPDIWRNGPEQEFFVSRFVDYANEDGLFRKYRVVFVAGRPYACHMAIADRWDIWYLNAGMSDERSQASRGRDVHAHLRHRLRAPPCDGAGRHGRSRSVSIISRSTARKTSAATCWFSRRTIPPSCTTWIRPKCFPTSRRRCARSSRPSRRCWCGRARAGAGARGVTKALREAPLQSESSETLDPKNWDEIRALGHRMLDDMIDYAANIRDRPVWQPIPDEVRARFRADASASTLRSRRCLSGVQPISSFPTRPATFIRASWAGCMAAAPRSACWRKCWRPDSMPISADAITFRSRSNARSSNGRAQMFGFPGRRERDFRHRHVDGQSDGGAGGANRGARTLGAAARPRRRRRTADGLYLDRGAWLHRQGDGHRGVRQRCVALHRGRSVASHRRGGIARADRAGPRRRAASRSWSSARPERWISARSTTCAR